jgi:LCP family protein required for cell wall assembly
MDIITPKYNSDGLRPKKQWFKKPLIFICIGVLIIAGAVWGVSRIFSNSFDVNNKETAADKKFNSENPIPKSNSKFLTVLILGNSVGRTDGAAEQTGAQLTDSMELLIVNRTTKEASLVSIPRDLYLEMKGTQGKINEAYVRGGFNFVGQLVSRITGIYVDKTILFDLSTFKDIVDALGGIDVHLDKPFSEPTQWTYPFNLPAGNNHLNGEQALYYVRSRYSSSDFDRARRQQEVMKAIKDKASSSGFLSNPIKAVSLFTQIKNNIKTNFNLWDIQNLLTLADSVKTNSIKDYYLTIDNVFYEIKAPEYILLPKGDNFNGVRTFFQNILNNKPQ